MFAEPIAVAANAFVVAGAGRAGSSLVLRTPPALVVDAPGNGDDEDGWVDALWSLVDPESVEVVLTTAPDSGAELPHVVRSTLRAARLVTPASLRDGPVHLGDGRTAVRAPDGSLALVDRTIGLLWADIPVAHELGPPVGAAEWAALIDEHRPRLVGGPHLPAQRGAGLTRFRHDLQPAISRRPSRRSGQSTSTVEWRTW